MKLLIGLMALALLGAGGAQAQLPKQTTFSEPSTVPRQGTLPRQLGQDKKPQEVVPAPKFSVGPGPLTMKQTPGERLVARFQQFDPKANLLETYASNHEKVRGANEFQRAEALQDEMRRLRQVSVAEEFWVGGAIEVGQYDRERRGFPVLRSQFTVPDRQDLLRFELADSSPLLFLPLQPAEAELVLAETGNSRQFQVMIKASPVAMEIRKETYSSKAILFGDVKSFVVWVPTRKDRNKAFLIASASVGSQAPVREPDNTPVKKAEMGALNFETIDLLLVKHAPELVTDDMYLHMLASRWSHERTPPKRMVPTSHLPRFFKPNQPPPNPVDSRRMLDAFKAWAKREASALPDQYQVLVSSGSSMWFQCTYFHGVAMGREAQRPPRLQGVMDNGEYASLLQRYADQEKANRDARAASGASPNRHYRMGPLYFSMGGHHEARPDLDGNAGCNNRVAYEAASRSLFGSQKVRGLARGVIEIPDWVVPSESSLAVPSVAESRVTGKLTDVRIAKGIEGPLVVATFVPTLVEELNAWDSSNIKVERTIDYASLAVKEALVSPTAPAPGPKPKQPVMDIVGIKLGMTFEEAEAIAAQHMTIGTRINFRPEKPGALPFSHGRLLVSEDKREYITLVDQPENTKGKVLAVGRMVLDEKKTRDAAQLINDLTEKYAVRMRYMISGVGFAYQSGGQKPGAKTPEGACYTLTGARSGVVYETEDGKRVSDDFYRLPERPSFSAQSLPTMGFRGDLADPRNFVSCLPHVSAIVPEKDGLIDHFTVWMTDPSVHFKAFYDAFTAPPSATPGTPAPQRERTKL